MIKFFRKNKNSKVGKRKVVIPDDIKDVKEFWLDYLVWGNIFTPFFKSPHHTRTNGTSCAIYPVLCKIYPTLCPLL